MSEALATRAVIASKAAKVPAKESELWRRSLSRQNRQIPVCLLDGVVRLFA